MNIEQIEEAIAEFEIWADEIDAEGLDMDGNLKHYYTAIKALRLAHKVMSEPSEGMCRAGEESDGGSSDEPYFDGLYTPENVEIIFKEMINAAIEEVGNE